MIRPSGGQPPAGLSTARGLATLRMYLVFSVTVISNVISLHGLPDRGTRWCHLITWCRLVLRSPVPCTHLNIEFITIRLSPWKTSKNKLFYSVAYELGVQGSMDSLILVRYCQGLLSLPNSMPCRQLALDRPSGRSGRLGLNYPQGEFYVLIIENLPCGRPMLYQPLNRYDIGRLQGKG
jgi:hypothetical protein